ncbi:hypothetical protein NDU88_001548 [Pleurodeles waltl]|uniref:Uncharacterized protein n=1 Tax=Pleurodeles waltl TaxID=8319 RepID=A0AAV7W1U8_PLEWA|nr:hypothetical protein NDU88_001548 [Pleurodeles waltl]
MADHNPLLLEVKLTGWQRPRKDWMFERALLNDSLYIQHMCKRLSDFLEVNMGTAPLEILWDTLKAVIWGETLGFCIRRQKLVAAQELMGKLNAAEEQLIKAVAPGTGIEQALHQTSIAKMLLDKSATEKIAAKYMARRSECYEYSEKVGHILAVKRHPSG